MLTPPKEPPRSWTKCQSPPRPGHLAHHELIGPCAKTPVRSGSGSCSASPSPASTYQSPAGWSGSGSRGPSGRRGCAGRRRRAGGVVHAGDVTGHPVAEAQQRGEGAVELEAVAAAGRAGDAARRPTGSIPSPRRGGARTSRTAPARRARGAAGPAPRPTAARRPRRDGAGRRCSVGPYRRVFRAGGRSGSVVASCPHRTDHVVRDQGHSDPFPGPFHRQLAARRRARRCRGRSPPR